MRKMQLVLLLILLPILSACGAHVSPKATETSRATVKSDTELCFMQLDGEKLHFLGLWPAHQLVVEPGSHNVNIRYKNSHYVPYNANWTITYTSYHDLTFIAQNNHSYIAKGVHRDGKHYVWIVDETTGKIVAGSMPSMR